MANTKSAEKRNRQSQKRRARNVAVRTSVKTAVKKVREAVARGDGETAKKALLEATSTLDRAASKGVLPKNTASRRIGRLAKAVQKSTTPAAQ